jgi:hypothetical protein
VIYCMYNLAIMLYQRKMMVFYKTFVKLSLSKSA